MTTKLIWIEWGDLGVSFSVYMRSLRLSIFLCVHLKLKTSLFLSNLIEFWLALKSENVKVDRNYLLYPNPWPKHKHIRKRWHAHPVMGILISLSDRLEIRTNWKIYAMEFCQSIEMSSGNSIKFERVQSKIPLTSFEKKYSASGHDLFQIIYKPKDNKNLSTP